MSTDQATLLLLRQAHQLLLPPGRWTQEALARDAQGVAVDLGLADDQAQIANILRAKGACFCILGALQCAAGMVDAIPKKFMRPYIWAAERAMRDTLKRLRKHHSFSWDREAGPLVEFNDAPERKHEEVLRLYALTIENLERAVKETRR